MNYLNITSWFSGSQSEPQEQVNQQPMRSETVEKTLTVTERTFKGLKLAGLNVATATLINLDLLREDSWLQKEYSAVWNGRTVEVVQRPENALVPFQDRGVEGRDIIEQNAQRDLAEVDQADTLVGRTFTVRLPEGLDGQLTVLAQRTTHFQAPEGSTKGQLPMLQQQQPSSALTRIWNGTAGALSQLFGGGGQTVAMREEQVVLKLRVGNIDTIFRMTISSSRDDFNPALIPAIAGQMLGQIGPVEHRLGVEDFRPQTLNAPEQQLLLRGSEDVAQTQVTVSMESIAIPRSLPMPSILQQQANPFRFNPLTGYQGVAFGALCGIIPFNFTSGQQALNRVDETFDLDQVVQEERPEVEQQEKPRNNRDQRNFGIFAFIFAHWASRARRGDFTNRNFNAQQAPENQSWYSRIFSLFSQAVSYLKQSVSSHMPANWWWNAAPVESFEVRQGRANVRVDLLSMEQNPDQRIERIME